MTDIVIRIYEVILVAFIVTGPLAIICVIVAFSREVIRAARSGGIGRVR